MKGKGIRAHDLCPDQYVATVSPVTRHTSPLQRKACVSLYGLTSKIRRSDGFTIVQSFKPMRFHVSMCDKASSSEALWQLKTFSSIFVNIQNKEAMLNVRNDIHSSEIYKQLDTNPTTDQNHNYNIIINVIHIAKNKYMTMKLVQFIKEILA